MTEQIGLMVAHEPHTDPQTMIEELQWELSSQREAWLQIVADKDAEINRLHGQVEQLEEICIMQSANLERYAQSELAHNRRATELRAKLEDLHNKYVAEQEELHELRIKAGIGQPQPDWSQAPPGYSWWAIDADGSTHWYAYEPHANKGLGGWYDDEDSSLHDESSLVPGWAASLHQRPQEGAEL